MNAYVFPSCAQDPVTLELRRFCEERDVLAYFTAFARLLDFSRKEGLTQSTIREYCVRMLLDAPWAGARFDDAGLLPYLQRDIEAIYNLYYVFDWQGWCVENNVLPPPGGAAAAKLPGEYRDMIRRLVAAGSASQLLSGLADFFTHNADRQEGVYTAFKWNGQNLVGVQHIDAICFDQLGGLNYQKQVLQQNTRFFLEGKPANDVLLVGGSGTGKSSCVKATLNHFAADGLKLVELPKQHIDTLSLLLRRLRHKKRRYLIFIDDLSFETADSSYMGLKVAMDGQIESRPDNVLIYATSNRRHLVRETWQERQIDDDLHTNDTLHEKMSLSERFGSHLYFSVLSQPEYFAVVELMLSAQGVAFSDDIAKSAAAWATANSGRSGRSAKQFVTQYLARQKPVYSNFNQ